MITEAHVATIVQRLVEGTDQFLVGVEVRPGGKVIVEVDTPRSITLAELTELNRAIRTEIENLGEDCELQVSSPGMGRPFKVPQQYAKHTGRVVVVKLHDGRTLTGRLEAFSPEAITLRVQQPVKVKGRPARFDEEPTVLPFPVIQSTKTSIPFN